MTPDVRDQLREAFDNLEAVTPEDVAGVLARPKRPGHRRVLAAAALAFALLVVGGVVVVTPGSRPSSRVATRSGPATTRSPRGKPALRAVSGVRPAISFGPVACRAPDMCVAVGPNNENNNSNSVYATSGTDGRVWVPRGQIAGEVDGVACGGPTTCVAVGSTGHGALVVWSTDTGRRWKRRAVPPTLTAVSVLSGVSCVTATRCALIGKAGGRQVLAVTTDGGRRWRVVSVPGTTNGSVTCPSADVCYVWGQRNTKRGAATAVVIKYRIAGDAAHLASKRLYPGEEIDGIGCASNSDCAGLAREQKRKTTLFQAIYTNDGGARWHFRANVGASSYFWSVACPSTQVCIAAGSAGEYGEPIMLLARTRDGGRNWQELDLNTRIPRVALAGASCVSPRLCVAVGGQSSNTERFIRFLLISHNAGKAWQHVRIQG